MHDLKSDQLIYLLPAGEAAALRVLQAAAAAAYRAQALTTWIRPDVLQVQQY